MGPDRCEWKVEGLASAGWEMAAGAMEATRAGALMGGEVVKVANDAASAARVAEDMVKFVEAAVKVIQLLVALLLDEFAEVWGVGREVDLDDCPLYGIVTGRDWVTELQIDELNLVGALELEEETLVPANILAIGACAEKTRAASIEG